MIDTVVLIIQEGFYKILNPDKFIPSANILSNSTPFGAKGYLKCVQNTSDYYYQKGLSKIKLALTKSARIGGFVTPLKIEFSASKLLFRNNLDELSETDFVLLIDTLQRRLLEEMSVEISKTSLQLAQVSVINFSKNIELPEFITSSMIIRDLAKVDITKRLSLDKTTFIDLGHALTFYSKSYAIVIYDKKKDIQKTGVKIDKDPTLFQQNLFSNNKPFYKVFPETLRIEIRLNHPYKIESMLKTIGKPKDRTFINLFKQDIAKSIILYHWELMTTGKNSFLFSSENDLEKIAQEIYKNNPKISAQKLLAIIGYLTFSKQKGVRILRQFIESKYTGRTWFRIANYSKSLVFYNSLSDKLKFWIDIRNAILEFKPIKPIDFQKEMINNDKDS